MAANLSQLFVGLFNAATGGYANQFTTSDANNLASVASMVTGKDLSNNTAFVNNVLTNLGVPASGAVRDAAFSAVLALVNTSGRGNAVLTAADYLANVAAKDATNQYYAVGQSFVAKVAAADAFTQTHSTELSAAALVGAATGTSTGTGFTAGTDTLLGTIGSDVFSSASGTLSTADKLIDSSTADSDILNIVFKSADVAAVPQPTINNIENINVSFDMIAGAEFDATNVTGATIGLSSPRSSFIGDVTIDAQGANNVKAGAGISGTVTVNGMNGGSIDLGSAKALTSTKATVTNKAVGYDLTVNGTATALDLDFGGTTNKILTLTATKDTTVTFDGTNTVATTIRGSGAGAITIKDAAANFTKATVTGISKLNMTKAGTASLTSVSSSTAIEASATGTYTLTALNGQSVTASFADTDLSLAPKTAGVSTVSVNVTANQSAGTGIVVGATTGFASAAVTLGPKVTAVNSLAYSGDTTVAIGGTTTITTLAELATTDTIKFSGSGSLTLDTTATDVAHNVDASGVTGDFTAKLGDTSTAAVIVGAQGTNTVETIETKGSVTYTGGAGKDTLTLASTTGKVTANLGDGTNKVVFTPAFASAKAVVNGGSGGDTIEIKDGTFAASASLTATLGAGNDTLKIGATKAGVTAADTVLNIDFGDGVDTLNLTKAADLAVTNALTTGAITFTGLENIKFDTSASVSSKILNGQTYTILGETGATNAFTISLTSGTSSADLGGLTLDSTVSTNTIDATNANNKVTVTGTLGNDKILPSTKSGDVLNGGAGNDTFDLSTTVDYSALSITIDGGTGTNTLKTGADTAILTSSATTTVSLANIQTLDLFGTTKAANSILKIDAALIDGQAFTLKDSGTKAGTLDVKLSSSTTSLDVSKLKAGGTAGQVTQLNGETLTVDAATNKSTSFKTFTGTDVMNNTVTFASTSVTATGGALIDTFTLGKNAAGSVLTGGDGADVFDLSLVEGSTATTFITIKDFEKNDATKAAVDTLDLVGASAVTAVTITGFTASAGNIFQSTIPGKFKLADFVVGAGAAMNAGGGVASTFAAFTDGTDLYIYDNGADITTTADDVLVKLVGLGQVNGVEDTAATAGFVTVS